MNAREERPCGRIAIRKAHVQELERERERGKLRGMRQKKSYFTPKRLGSVASEQCCKAHGVG